MPEDEVDLVDERSKGVWLTERTKCQPAQIFVYRNGQFWQQDITRPTQEAHHHNVLYLSFPMIYDNLREKYGLT